MQPSQEQTPGTIPDSADKPVEGAPDSDQAPAQERNVVTVDRTTGLYRRSSRRRGHTGSREARLKQSLLVTRLFAGVAVAAGVVLALLLIQAQSQLANVNADSGAIASELKRTQSELDQAKKLVAAQDVELGALVRQRIPGVETLELDRLYDAKKGVVKKISFSESGVGASKKVAYYAVLKNTGPAPVEPTVRILLFDRKGLQTGAVTINREAATTPVEGDALAPGETRTYSAPVEMIRRDAPRYFLIETGP